MKIAVLITCYNRKAKTIACLNSLYKNTLPADLVLDVYLLDDGSVDGTAEAVRACYPYVNILKGDGNCYWNGGMRIAFAAAIKQGFDYYLWINDDVALYPLTIRTLIATEKYLHTQQGVPVAVVGSFQYPIDGRLTYGGVIRPCKWKPVTFKFIAPRDVPVKCETMNGNCVLIPHAIANVVGNLDGGFAHAMGDMDYGLRAARAGFETWVMPLFAGTCAVNKKTETFNDANLPVMVRLRKMMQPKGLPLSSWRVFTQRHAGIFWPIFWLWPYAKVLLKGLVKR